MQISFPDTASSSAAEMAIKGITVIAGENNTGKTMVVESLITALATDLLPVFINDTLLVAMEVIAYAPGALGYFPQRVTQVLQPLLQRPMVRGEEAIPGVRYKEELTAVFKELESIGVGRMMTDKARLVYSTPKGKFIPMDRVASGLKIFALLLELVLTGVIAEKSVLVLEEPESHLHPKWQIVLARVLIQLQKALDLRILITSHSPYLVSSIDVYSKNEEIIANNRYYFCESSPVGNQVKDVTDKIAVIYDSFAEPYQIIQDADMEHEWGTS